MSSRGYYKDSGPLECKVYVGDLGSGASRNDIEDAFREYGELKNVWVARNPPGFAFVEFEDARDAKEACDAMDGRRLCGRRIKVEMSSGETRRGGGRGGGYGRGPPPRRTDERCYECGESGHYARDCHNSRGSSSHDRRGGGYRRRSRSRSRSRSYSPRRRYSRSRSRSRSRSSRD